MRWLLCWVKDVRIGAVPLRGDRVLPVCFLRCVCIMHELCGLRHEHAGNCSILILSHTVHQYYISTPMFSLSYRPRIDLTTVSFELVQLEGRSRCWRGCVWHTNSMPERQLLQETASSCIQDY